jgi:ArsR family metal-binding transcriptional regulator
LSRLVTTFLSQEEFAQATRALDRLGLAYDVVSPAPRFALVGASAVVVDEESRRTLSRPGGDFFCAGWVEYRETALDVQQSELDVPIEGVFGRAAITVLAPCVADVTKIRLIAQLTGDVGAALPYLNAEMERASFNPQNSVLTFMDAHRLVSVHPRRITVAKADEIVDGWRTLDEIRRRVEDVWARRAEIEPSFETRERPPALEIFKRLPRTNCKRCREPSCLAFAVRVWNGEATVGDCTPVFDREGTSAGLREALEEVCAGLGV